MSQISVTVDGPEGLPEPRVTLRYTPATAREFDALVEAFGGPSEFSVCGDFVYSTPDHVGPDAPLSVHIHEPADAEPPKPAPHPFLETFLSRIHEARDARERVEQMT